MKKPDNKRITKKIKNTIDTILLTSTKWSNFKLSEFSKVITTHEISKEIYATIKKELNQHETIVLDMADIEVMTTNCSCQIFGELYKELGPDNFYEKISIKNADDDMKIIIQEGIK